MAIDRVRSHGRCETCGQGPDVIANLLVALDALQSENESLTRIVEAWEDEAKLDAPGDWNRNIADHDLRPGDWVLWQSEKRGLCRGRVMIVWEYGLIDVDDDELREVPVARTDVVAVWRPPGPPDVPEVLP